MKITQSLLKIAVEAKKAAQKLRVASTAQKNNALKAIAQSLHQAHSEILKANDKDLQNTLLSESQRDRINLSGHLDGVIADIHTVAGLTDPVGEMLEQRSLANGLKLQKKRVPIGVIGVIYEARPNVTVDISSLALKTGNCAILRGGKETMHTNQALIKAIQSGLATVDLPIESIQLIKNPSRSQIKQLVKLDDYIDMIIPRGGAGLHRFCKEESTIPVITGGIGICHLFVDDTADIKKAIDVIVNAKTQRPSVCNALDTLLVHRRIATTFLPALIPSLHAKGVSFRLDDEALEILKNQKGSFQKAVESDWHTEWLSLVLGIKIVGSLDEAIKHIQTYSSHHSDGILTNSHENALKFVEAVDSGAVYINASTRFTDGAQFGLGAEVAISTQKLHARGPMGLKELTSYKWIVEGDYHVRN